MKDSMKWRWVSLNSQESGIDANSCFAPASFDLQPEGLCWRAVKERLWLSVFAHMA
jgi:hypothetical protein